MDIRFLCWPYHREVREKKAKIRMPARMTLGDLAMTTTKLLRVLDDNNYAVAS